jgi:hypothetical protein
MVEMPGPRSRCAGGLDASTLDVLCNHSSSSSSSSQCLTSILMQIVGKSQLHRLHRQLFHRFQAVERRLSPLLDVPAPPQTLAVKGGYNSTSKKKKGTQRVAPLPPPQRSMAASSPPLTATVDATAASLFAVQNLVKLCKDLHLPVSYKVRAGGTASGGCSSR